MDSKSDHTARFEQALTPGIYQAAWRYACWLSATREDAEDLLQESLVKALRHLGQLHQEQAFKHWLLKIVRTTHLMHRRSRRNGIVALTDAAADRGAALVELTTTAHANPRSELIAQAIPRLPAAQRELLVLFYLEGYSLKEVAGILGITPKAVVQRLHRARGALRKLVMAPADATGLAVNEGVSE